MASKPPLSEPNHRSQRPRLWKQVSRARDDLQRLRSLKPCECPFVELDHTEIQSAHDQERRRAHPIECISSQVGTSAARDHGAHPIAEPGRRHKGRGRPGTGTAQSERKTAHATLSAEPAYDLSKPSLISRALRARHKAQPIQSTSTALWRALTQEQQLIQIKAVHITRERLNL